METWNIYWRNCRFENTRLREEFKTKVEKFQETLKEVKTLEEERNGLKRSLCEEKAKFKEKEDENQTLKITIEVSFDK